MGRPINKKYFGNRNIGTTGTGDNNIGGEGIASINLTNLGSFRGNGTGGIIDGLALPAPTIPTGVQATWTIVYEVESVTTGAGKAGLVAGDTYTFAGTGNAVFTVSNLAGANAIFTVTNRGTGISSLPADTQTVSITKLTGSGANTFTVDINFRIKSLTINEKGSGYTGNETFTVTIHAGAVGTPPAGTIVLTTDSGNVGSSTNQENAIIAYAYVGGSRRVVDIVKQSGRSRYTVRASSGTYYRAKLKGTGDASATGEMDMYAYDSAGNTYYVTKLTQRRAYLTRKSGGSNYVYANGESAPWSFAAASGAKVKINNA